MNKLQKKELDLLEYFINICNELNLTYYLVCGSTLGAVKYQGFIPWDDDIDVGLCREEYEIFLEKAPQYLEKGLFLQNYRSDSDFPHIFSKLRDSNTTFIEKNKRAIKMNHGVYIDIFPLDGYPTRKIEQKMFEIKKNMYSRKVACVFTVERGLKSKLSCFIHKILGCHKRTSNILGKYEEMISRYSTKYSSIWCNHGNGQGKLEYAPKEQYGKGTMVKFEGLTVRIPEDYDAYLTQKYGDWRADLPEEEQKGHHYYEICDLNRSYVDYIEKLPNGKIRLKISSNITKDI